MLGCARSALLCRSTRLARHLGSWETQFEATRGAPLAARQELSAQVEGAWVLGRDDDEAAAMAAEAGAPAENQITYVLRVEQTTVGILRAALVNGNTGVLVGTDCDPALTLSAVGKPLVGAALEELKARGAERVVAVAPLARLCAWVAEHKLWEKLGEIAPDHDAEQVGAVEAVARGVPRPGHSVLGHGTFAAARPAFEKLASAYVAQAVRLPDPDSEAAMFVHSGGEVLGINWMQATDEDSLRDCAGCAAHIRMLGSG